MIWVRWQLHNSNDGINEKYLLKAVETAVSRISFHWIIWKIPSDRQKVFYGATFKPYPGCYISYARCCAGTWSWVLTQKVKLFIAFSNYIIPASTSALSQICMQTPPIWCESDMYVLNRGWKDERTPSKKRDQWITELYWKSNGKIEIFGKKM